MDFGAGLFETRSDLTRLAGGVGFGTVNEACSIACLLVCLLARYLGSQRSTSTSTMSFRYDIR